MAARAQVSKPVVYEHFGGKEGLYAVVVDREITTISAAISSAIADPAADAAAAPEAAPCTWCTSRSWSRCGC